MQDDGKAGGGAFRWYGWARAVSRDPDLSTAAKLLAWLLADHANAAGRCWPSRKRLLAETALTLSVLKRATAALRDAGWIEVDAGHGDTASRYKLREGSQADPGRGRSRTRGGVAGDPREGSQADLGTTQRTTQGSENAPVGARSLDDSITTAAMEEESTRLLDRHAEVVAAHNGASPRSPGKRDRDAALDLVRRLGDGWDGRLVEILTFALAKPFWASKVATVAGLGRSLDGLLAEVKAAGGEGREMKDCEICMEREPCRWEPPGFGSIWICEDCEDELRERSAALGYGG